jgi:hypothetical protein
MLINHTNICVMFTYLNVTMTPANQKSELVPTHWIIQILFVLWQNNNVSRTWKVQRQCEWGA